MASPAAGRLTAVHLCVARGPMRRVGAVAARADLGLEGDRHARAGSLRQVLLADAAVLAEERLDAGAIRENLTVAGLPLDSLAPGTRLRVGDAAVLRLTKPCDPCGLMDTVRPGLQERLRGRRGMLAVVESGGEIREGDGVAVI